MSEPAQIDPREAARELDAWHVVDVREPHEYHGPLGRIPGAVLAPLGELDAAAPGLRGRGPLLVVCRSGRRSAAACARLAEQGIGPATNLAGGMIAWNRAGLPVAHSEPPTRAALLESIAAWLAQVSALAPDAAHRRLAERIERAGGDPRDPSPAALERTLAFVEASLCESGAPPADLGLAMAGFRRALAVL